MTDGAAETPKPDAAVLALVSEHSSYFSVQPDGRILCRLNGHTFPAQLAALRSYIDGKKFQRLLQKDQGRFKKYEPFLLQSTLMSSKLFCTLTGQHLDRSEPAVKKHMAGKRFLKQKERFLADDWELISEYTREQFEERRSTQEEMKDFQKELLGVRQKVATALKLEKEASGKAEDGGEASSSAPQETTPEGGHQNGSQEEPGFWVPEWAPEVVGMSSGDGEPSAGQESQAAASASGSEGEAAAGAPDRSAARLAKKLERRNRRAEKLAALRRKKASDAAAAGPKKSAKGGAASRKTAGRNGVGRKQGKRAAGGDAAEGGERKRAKQR